MERYAGRFGLLRRLGKGGMGEVYLAVDLSSGAEHALKRITRRADGPPPATLQREFEALARVRHPVVVRVIELGFDFEGAPFLLMEYVPGWPADEVLRPGDWGALHYVAARVAAGLEAIHAAGIVHGDLKPSNVLVVPSPAGGRPRDVRIVDFGLAALRGEDAEGHRGTAGFTAPEVVRGEAPSPAADLYALGTTLYAIGTGRAPFEGADASSILRRQQAGPPSALALEEAGVPAGLVQIILQLTAPAATERPRSATDVRRALEALSPAARSSFAERLQSERLVGRDLELSRLDREWRRAAKGARVVFLRGDAGAGKTALLGELATRGQMEGRSAIRLAALASGEPGALWRQLLRRLAADARVDIAEALDRNLRDALEAPGSENDEPVMAALLAKASEWCKAIAARGAAAAVIVDDSENLDGASRRAMRRLMLAAEAAPALWVVARRVSGDAEPEDERLLTAAQSATEMRLEPLTKAAIGSLIGARLQVEAPAPLVEVAWERAAGHPGLTVEWLRSAAGAGAVLEDDLGVRVDADRLAAVPISSGFEASRLERLAASPGASQRAAEVLAFCRRPREFEYLRRVAPELSERDFERLLQEGLANRDADGGWTLSPSALAAPLCERTAAERRLELHRAILAAGDLSAREEYQHRVGVGDNAGALAAAERAYTEGADPTLAIELADLLEPADSPGAARWCDRAARELMDRGRYAAALPIVERALRLDDGSPDRPKRWGWLTTCLLRVGELDRLEAAVAEAKKQSLPDGVLAAVLTNEAGGLNSRGQTDLALACVADAIEHATRAQDGIGLGNALLGRAATLRYLERNEESLKSISAATIAFKSAGAHMGALRAESARVYVLRTLLRLQEAEAICLESLGEARRAHLRLPMDELLTNLGAIYSVQARWRDARKAQAACVQIALEDERPLIAAVGYANLAMFDGLMGAVRVARIEASTAIDLARTQAPRTLPLAFRSLAQALRVTGHLKRASIFAARASSNARAHNNATEILWAGLERARLAAARNDWRRVREITLSALPLGPDAEAVAAAGLIAMRGRAELRAGDLDAASKSAEQALARLATTKLPYARAFADQLSAEIELSKGASREAAALAARVLEAFSAILAVPDRAAAALDFARLAMRAGGIDDKIIAGWLSIAEELFGRLGDRRSHARALLLHLELLQRKRAMDPIPVREHDLIEEVSRLLDSMSDFDELLQRAMRLAVKQLDAECGVLLLHDPETGRLEPRAEYGEVGPEKRREVISYSRGAVERAVESGTALLIHDAPTDPRARSESVMSLRLRSILCVPMYRGGRVIGAVYLDDTRQTNTFEEADRALMEGFAQLMAIAIDNSRGQEEVRRTNEKLIGENLSLRQELEARFRPSGIIGTSAAMVKLLSVVERAALGSSTVLLTGENGTGKELIARVMHHSGKRRLGPFISVNCGAIPETLIESELFGHEKGAFTDAHQSRKGRFEQAEGGTLFLDEIGEMPLSQQVRLLTAISNREVTPVGGSKPVPVDVRIIAATNQDLRRRISEGRFREDLFYRLNVIPIEVPPLRDRKADIPSIARHFADYFARIQERETPELTPEFLAALMQSDWPGNVRELQNYVERVMAMTPGNSLHPQPLPRDLEERGAGLKLSRRRNLADQVAEMVRRAILEALDRASGNQSLAARELGMTEQALRYRLKKYGHTGHRQFQRIRKIRRSPRN